MFKNFDGKEPGRKELEDDLIEIKPAYEFAKMLAKETLNHGWHEKAVENIIKKLIKKIEVAEINSINSDEVFEEIQCEFEKLNSSVNGVRGERYQSDLDFSIRIIADVMGYFRMQKDYYKACELGESFKRSKGLSL